MAGQLTIDTLRAGSGVLATQNGMTGIAKAWVNYNGATQTINNSFNVSSVTRNGTGDYTINFTTAMPNTSYVGTGSTNLSLANYALIVNFPYGSAPTTTAARFATGNYNILYDTAYVSVAFFSS